MGQRAKGCGAGQWAKGAGYPDPPRPAPIAIPKFKTERKDPRKGKIQPEKVEKKIQGGASVQEEKMGNG